MTPDATSTKSKHTPGPWVICHEYETVKIRTVEAPAMVLAHVIGGLDDDCDNGPTTEANARLIAEAPALYQELRDHLADHAPCGCGRCVRGKALLARIDGA